MTTVTQHHEGDAPSDAELHAFWEATLADHVAARPEYESRDVTHPFVDYVVKDVSFAGFAGDPVRGWFITRSAATTSACVVQFLGYNGGRGEIHEWLPLPAAGYATFVMDTRGQTGETSDPHPSTAHFPGYLTDGLRDPADHYYRRVYSDAVAAIRVAGQLPGVVANRIAVSGGSQGGGIAIAATALEPTVRAAVVDFPFLADIVSAARVASAGPYLELVELLRRRPELEADAARTFEFIDVVRLGSWARVPAQFSVGGLDSICPPASVRRAFDAWGGPKTLLEFPFSEHERPRSILRSHLQFLSKTLP